MTLIDQIYDPSKSKEPLMSAENDKYAQVLDTIRKTGKTSPHAIAQTMHMSIDKVRPFVQQAEEEGIVSKPNVTGKRTILVP